MNLLPRRQRPLNPTKGFTLIEMLLATVLSTCLMVALMTLASAADQDRARLQQAHHTPDPGWVHATAKQIELDLLMGLGLASHVSVHPQGGDTSQTLHLVTHQSLANLTPNHRPTLVSYTLTPSGQSSVLTRRETPLTRRSSTSPTTTPQDPIQVVATGIQQLSIGNRTLALGTPTTRRAASSNEPPAFALIIQGQSIPFDTVPGQIDLSIQTLAPETPAPTQTFSRTLFTQ